MSTPPVHAARELHPARYARLREVLPPLPGTGTGGVSWFAVQRIADWLETPISPEDLALLSDGANGLATTSHRWWSWHQHRDHHRYAVRAKKAAYDYGFQAGKREGRAGRKLVAEKSFSRGYQEGLAHRDIEVLADPGITGNTMADNGTGTAKGSR